MRALITPAQMREMEELYFARTGTPSIDLMERAATKLCLAIQDRYGRDRKVWFACGPGGNGGDGYACARLYAKGGGRCAVVCCGMPKSADARVNRERALEAGVAVLEPERLGEAPDIWVDALYGTGLSRAPEGAAAALIGRMNADRQSAGARIVAVDIPSGLNGTDGRAFDPCVRADLTVTFQFEKTGLWLGDGLDACGEIRVADIGIPEAHHPRQMAALLEDEDVRGALPAKPRNAHKGKNGHLLIVAGSVGMAGAAVLCTRSALRSGAGLVTVACPASILPVLQTAAPCAMAVPLPERDGAIAPEARERVPELLKGKHAAVCGCGLSRRADPGVLEALMAGGLPLLLDADALNIIARSEALKGMLAPHHLITPHPGEAARLLGRSLSDPLSDARALRAMGCQGILKNAASIVPTANRCLISASGCAGMAKGGSGDVLAGLCGGLMAQFAAAGRPMEGDALARAAALADEIHGRAGELAQRRVGPRGMCAEDLVEAIPEAFRTYE